jgi:hypothetical protein
MTSARAWTDAGRCALRDLASDQGLLAHRLVRLEPIPVPELRRASRALRTALLVEHCRPKVAAARPPTGPTGREEILARDHRWFETSLGELDSLLDVVESDPHGGNRQALGQYWKVLLEALDRHLDEEGVPPVGPGTERTGAWGR